MCSCSFILLRQWWIAINSALGTVCSPPRAPLVPYRTSLLEPCTGPTQAQPHRRNLLSFVRLPPEPSVKIVIFLSWHSDMGFSISTVSNICPMGSFPFRKPSPSNIAICTRDHFCICNIRRKICLIFGWLGAWHP